MQTLHVSHQNTKSKPWPLLAVIQGTEKREDDAWKVDHAMTHFSAVTTYDTVNHKLEDMVIPSLQFLWPPSHQCVLNMNLKRGNQTLLHNIADLKTSEVGTE